jgi:hypothetical protein
MRTVIAILSAVIVALAVYLVSVHWWPVGHGSIVITSEPPGAQIWIDLQPTDIVTNGKVNGITRGKHSVTVRLDTLLADPFARVVDVRSGTPDTVHFVMREPHGGMESPSFGKHLAVAPESQNLIPADEFEQIPTAAQVRGSPISDGAPGSQSPDSLNAGSNPASSLIPPRESVDVSEPPPSLPTGAIEISSSVEGAKIFVNDHEIPERTPANITEPFGTYTVHVELKGYTVTPDEQSVRISRAAASQSVHFTMQKAAPPVRAFTVETSPEDGRIFVDGDFVGEGTATVNRDFGTYIVSFGDLEGWRTPDSVRVTLTPGEPQAEVKVKYTRLFHAYAQVDSDGTVKADGINHWSTGVVFEKGKPEPSVALGPKIRKLPDTGLYGWELGMGDPNHNPTGGDYVMFTFTLPPDVPPDTPLSLRLYVYKSSKRYPFSLIGRADVVVEVNGRRFLDGFAPQYDINGAGQNQYEEWSLRNALIPGENQVLVYTGSSNTVFEYLRKVEIQ